MGVSFSQKNPNSLTPPVYENMLATSVYQRAGSFTLIVFLLSCGCLCYVSIPHGAVGWPAVSECGISWSYSLFILFNNVKATFVKFDSIFHHA